MSNHRAGTDSAVPASNPRAVQDTPLILAQWAVPSAFECCLFCPLLRHFRSSEDQSALTALRPNLGDTGRRLIQTPPISVSPPCTKWQPSNRLWVRERVHGALAVLKTAQRGATDPPPFPSFPPAHGRLSASAKPSPARPPGGAPTPQRAPGGARGDHCRGTPSPRPAQPRRSRAEGSSRKAGDFPHLNLHLQNPRPRFLPSIFCAANPPQPPSVLHPQPLLPATEEAVFEGTFGKNLAVLSELNISLP